MDLELSDEQTWLSEAVGTLLERKADELWPSLVEFGALSVGGDEGLGAVELCLIARALGAHLAAVPYIGSAAVRFAAEADLGDDAVALAVLEPGSSWAAAPASVVAHGAVSGRKVAVEHAEHRRAARRGRGRRGRSGACPRRRFGALRPWRSRRSTRRRRRTRSSSPAPRLSPGRSTARRSTG